MTGPALLQVITGNLFLANQVVATSAHALPNGQLVIGGDTHSGKNGAESAKRGTKTEKRDVIKKRSPNLAQREQKIGAVPLGWLKLIRSAFP
jgi:hypothetical protein